VPPGAIKHIVVVNLENEDYGDTFGPNSPATYLNGTIGDRLDSKPGASAGPHITWRAYAEDMGNIRSRDYGVRDSMGGTECAHPPLGGVDISNQAVAGDPYATRHFGFLYMHSVIGDVAPARRTSSRWERSRWA
jgi:hypothetical protein